MERRKWQFWTINLTEIARKGDLVVYRREPSYIKLRRLGKKKKFKNYYMELYESGKPMGHVQHAITSPGHCHGHNVEIKPHAREKGNALFLLEEALKFLWKTEGISSVDTWIEIHPRINRWAAFPATYYGLMPLFDQDFGNTQSIYLCLTLGFKLDDILKLYGGVYRMLLRREAYEKLVNHAVERRSRKELEQEFEEQKAALRANLMED